MTRARPPHTHSRPHTAPRSRLHAPWHRPRSVADLWPLCPPPLARAISSPHAAQGHPSARAQVEHVAALGAAKGSERLVVRASLHAVGYRFLPSAEASR